MRPAAAGVVERLRQAPRSRETSGKLSIFASKASRSPAFNSATEEVNELLTKAAVEAKWAHLFAVTDEPLVSSDIVGARFASIADLGMTRVVDGNLIKVLAWYDNETSYTHTLVEHVGAVARSFNSKAGV